MIVIYSEIVKPFDLNFISVSLDMDTLDDDARRLEIIIKNKMFSISLIFFLFFSTHAAQTLDNILSE